MSKPKLLKKDGTPDRARQKRYDMIVSKLTPLAGRSFPCKALGGVDVHIYDISIEEIAFHASKSAQSTSAALDVVHQLAISEYPHIYARKEGTQRTKFHFQALFVMQGVYNGKRTKITVGAKANGKIIQYCLTSNE